MSSSSSLSLWGALFLLSLLFLFPLFYSFEGQLKLFLVQESMSVLFLLLLFLAPSWPLFMLLFLLKMGMVPFHSWAQSLLQELSWKELFFFFSLMKVLPLWFLFQEGLSKSFLLLMGLFSCLALLAASGLKEVLLFSSSSYTFWALLLKESRSGAGALFFFMYSFILFWAFFKGEGGQKVSFLFFFILMGVPPFPFFFMEWLALEGLFSSGALLSFLLLHALLLSVYVYFRVLFSLFKSSTFSEESKGLFSFSWLFSATFLGLLALFSCSIFKNCRSSKSKKTS